MSELPVEDAPGVSVAAHQAAGGRVVYLTEHGQRLAAIVPAEFAVALEQIKPADAASFLEDLADVFAFRDSLAVISDGAALIPADEVWAELGI